MPVERRTVDLTLGDLVQIVTPGQRINGLSCIRAASGVFYGVKFGNNAIVQGFSGKQTFVIGSDAPASDVREGVWIQALSASPGITIDFMVSYWSGGAP